MTPARDLDWGWATEYDDVSGAVAICGVGESEHTKASGRTVPEISALAVAGFCVLVEEVMSGARHARRCLIRVGSP